MSSKRKSPSRKPKKSAFNPALWLMIGGGLLILAVVLYGVFANRPGGNTSGQKFTGGPHLTADRDEIDYGNVKLGKQVTATFTLTNAGDAPLTFSEAPYIELKEGC